MSESSTPALLDAEVQRVPPGGVHVAVSIDPSPHPRPGQKTGGEDPHEALEGLPHGGVPLKESWSLAEQSALSAEKSAPAHELRDGFVEDPRAVDVDGVAGVGADDVEVGDGLLGVRGLRLEALLARSDDEERTHAVVVHALPDRGADHGVEAR